MTLNDLREQLTVELASLDIVDTTLREIADLVEEGSLTQIERAAAFSLLLQLYGGFEHQCH